MRTDIKVILYLLFLPILFNTVSSFGQEPIPVQKPEYYLLEWPHNKELFEKETGISFEVDSVGTHEVRLIVDTRDRPKAYTSDIATPVCADGECRLMHLKLFWTLLGNYAGFSTYPGLPLTKHDHDPFQKEDYAKLHALLMDRRSILERRTIDELVEKPKKRKVNGIDALSGATIAEVKESVVPGALYSCYVAWHLANGHLRDSIRAHSKKLSDSEMLADMLHSNTMDYHIYAVSRFNATQYNTHHKRIAEIFRTGSPLLRGIIIKNQPNSFWSSQKRQRPFWDAFLGIDLNSKSLLLEHLDKAPIPVLEDISSYLGTMSKNQLKVYLEHLAHLSHIPSKIQDNLKETVKSDNHTYTYLIEEFLEGF
ncbi:MAG: hypothetical protein AAGA86_10720 [Bacteroidota bacterium]